MWGLSGLEFFSLWIEEHLPPLGPLLRPFLSSPSPSCSLSSSSPEWTRYEEIDGWRQYKRNRTTCVRAPGQCAAIMQPPQAWGNENMQYDRWLH